MMELLTRILSAADLARVRANRLKDLARYYRFQPAWVCPACLREYRCERPCPRCRVETVQAGDLADRVLARQPA